MPLRILSLLQPEELRFEAASARHPKWSTACLLKYLGCSVVDACYLLPEDDPAKRNDIITHFRERGKWASLLVRSDGGSERSDYHRGGYTLPSSRIPSEVDTLLEMNRGVLLFEPVDRFRNRLAVNLLIDRCGQLVMEMLGPGFDVTDLNRGGITAEVIVRLNDINWSEFRKHRRSEFSVTHHLRSSNDQRLQQRLRNIARYALPAIGIQPSGGHLEFAERWLRERGYMGLWEDWEPPTSRAFLQKLYEDAFMIANHFGPKTWTCLACSASGLASGGLVYWDIVNSATKFKL